MSTHIAALRQTVASCSSTIADCGQRVMGSETESQYCLPTVYQSRILLENIMEAANLSMKHGAVLFKLLHNRVVSSLPRLYDTLSSHPHLVICVYGLVQAHQLWSALVIIPCIVRASCQTQCLNDVGDIQCKAVLSCLRTFIGRLYKCEAYISTL